ncbi:MAG: peptidyl-prolyl cis-trans isomerase [Caulobacter sp.]|jgi:peptidyl-prolyl cis-trans isomerase C|nr:peptidyl-prolyl cis-trans isomerase [Caulobacter sp.]
MLHSLVVDGVEIPEFLIAAEVQNHPGPSAAEARKAAGKALAVKALLLHRADELGLRPEPRTDDDGREETEEDALIRAVLDAEVETDPPGEAECRRVYEARPELFTSPALVEAAHILIEARDDSAEGWELARRRGEDILRAVITAPGSFAATAKAVSDCTSREVGGSLGQLAPGDLVGEVEAALSGLQAGQILDHLVRSRFGWHLLKLDRRIEGQLLPFAYVHHRISLHLESRAWTAAAIRYVADLADRARARGVAFSLTRDGRFATDAPSLGQMLAEGVSTERLEAWLDTADPDLAARVREAAREGGVAVADLVRASVTAFVNTADDERWTHLISAAQGADDPAIAAMASILKSRLTPATRTYTVVRRR